MVIIEGIPFHAKGMAGDFKYEVRHRENTLFIINENYIDKMETEPIQGAGTACLRHRTPRFSSSPVATGVTTGWSKNTGGFTKMNDFVKRAIDLDFERIHKLIELHNFTHLVFSCDSNDPTKLGCNIFRVNPEVLDYISKRIWSTNDDMKKRSPRTLDRIEKMEYQLLEHAVMADENIIMKRKLIKMEDARQSKRNRPAWRIY
jgi:hypothetical protein